MSELQIGEQEYAEILITDADGGLLVSITDKLYCFAIMNQMIKLYLVKLM